MYVIPYIRHRRNNTTPVGRGRRAISGRLREVSERRRDAAWLVRHSGCGQAHLHGTKGAGQHQVVETPEMADPEHLARELTETSAERHVETLEHDAPELVSIQPLGHQHRRRHVRTLARLLAQDIKAPRTNR